MCSKGNVGPVQSHPVCQPAAVTVSVCLLFSWGVTVAHGRLWGWSPGPVCCMHPAMCEGCCCSPLCMEDAGAVGCWSCGARSHSEKNRLWSHSSAGSCAALLVLGQEQHLQALQLLLVDAEYRGEVRMEVNGLPNPPLPRRGWQQSLTEQVCTFLHYFCT